MPKSKLENFIFTVMMAFIMVYAMICYNIALNIGGMTNQVFVMAFHELVIMWPVAIILELVIAERAAKFLTFKAVDPRDTKPLMIQVILCSMIVCVMCPRIRNVKKLGNNKRAVQAQPKKTNAIKVLICDDSSTDRKICKKVLESQDWIETVEAPSAKDALNLLDRDKGIDLIISDIMMPDMDGFRLSRSIREKGYEVPIIAVSARMEPSDRKKMSASGINAFVQKPINQQLLLDKIDELISQQNNNG